MPKNMTRASVALTAAATLVAGAFAGAPAFAAQADTSFVALAPTDGESYNVLAIAGQDFSLSANQASSITATGRTVKFLISDPNDVADVAYNSVGIALTPQVDDNLGVVLDDAADTIRINDPDLSNALSAGERIVLGGALEIADADSPTGTCTKTVIDANTVVTVSAVVAGTSVTLKTKDLSAITLDSDTACDTWAEMDKVAGAETVKVLANAKSATTKSFVVETGVDTNTSDKVLKLENLASTATVSVDVTAWVDDN